MKKFILIIMFIIFYSCGEKQEKVDNCTFVKKWDIVGLLDIANSPFYYYFGLYILYGVGEYLTHFIGEIPVETFKLGETNDGIFRHNLAVSKNYIYIFGGAFIENPPYDVILEKYTLEGILLNRWKYNDLGLNFSKIESVSADLEDNFYILGEEAGNGDFLIAKFNSDGNFLSQWRLGLDPYHISVYRDNNLYVLLGGEKIKKFTLNGELIQELSIDDFFEKKGILKTFSGVNDIYRLLSIDDNYLYVLLGGKKIKKFTLNGELIQELNIDDFFEKKGILKTFSIVYDGKIFALGRHDGLGVEDYKSMIVFFSPEGELIDKWEKCRDEDGNVKKIFDYANLAVEQWGENQYKAYIGDEIYILQLSQ